MVLEYLNFIFEFSDPLIIALFDSKLTIVNLKLLTLGFKVVQISLNIGHLLLKFLHLHMMLPPDFINLPVVLLSSPELNLFLLELEFAVILTLHEAQLILFLPGFGIGHVDLLDKLLCLDFIKIDFVHLVFQLLHQPLVGGI